jgi:hypothetical protein
MGGLWTEKKDNEGAAVTDDESRTVRAQCPSSRRQGRSDGKDMKPEFISDRGHHGVRRRRREKLRTRRHASACGRGQTKYAGV